MSSHFAPKRFRIQPLALGGLLLLNTAALLNSAALAQAGGGGAAGGGAAAGASGPGAAAAASGQAASSTASAQGTGQGTGQGTAQQAATGEQSPSAYAAGTIVGPDPRKAPTSTLNALTMAQILDLARTRNPTLLAAEQNLRSVQAQEIQAGVRANPFLTVYGTDVTENADAANPYNYSVQVSRLFERGEKRRWRLDAAKATTAQTRAQLEDTIRQTELTIKTAFTHMLIAKDAAQLSVANLKDFQHQVDIAQERYKAGDLAKLDFERLDLQLGSFESDQATDVITLTQASEQLQTLIGLAAPSPDPNVFDIAGAIVPPFLDQTQDQLLQAALANRPDYAAARFGVEAANANAKLAVANGTTDPTLEAEYDRSGTENSAGFSVNIPLRIFDRNQGNKATTRFLATASQFTATSAKNQVVSDVAQAWIGYVTAKRLSDRFADHYLDESQDVLGIARFAFEHGGIALIDYLDAIRDARSSTSDALNAYQQTWLAIHQLSAASASNLTP